MNKEEQSKNFNFCSVLFKLSFDHYIFNKGLITCF